MTATIKSATRIAGRYRRDKSKYSVHPMTKEQPPLGLKLGAQSTMTCIKGAAASHAKRTKITMPKMPWEKE